MVFTTDALVLRTVDTGEHDRLAILLTPENGQITVLAKGARSQKSQYAALTQPFVYGNFEIYRKGEMNWLRGGSVTEYFPGVREDIVKLSLAVYLADVAREVTGEYVAGVDILRMTLNSLYALARDKVTPRIVKAVYEWRTAGYAGYMPDMSHCRVCHGEITEGMYLDVMNGRLLCGECLRRMSAAATREAANAAQKGAVQSAYDDTAYNNNILVPMGLGAVAAAGYVLHALPERVYSFRIKDAQDEDDFCRAGETYLLNHLECGFASLDFYKTITK